MEDLFEILRILFVPILILVLIFGGIFALDSVSCTAKTEDMGFDHRYSVLGGCQIEVNPNQWIPLESYYFKEE